jgi:hypothetical protein
MFERNRMNPFSYNICVVFVLPSWIMLRSVCTSKALEPLLAEVLLHYGIGYMRNSIYQKHVDYPNKKNSRCLHSLQMKIKNRLDLSMHSFG